MASVREQGGAGWRKKGSGGRVEREKEGGSHPRMPPSTMRSTRELCRMSSYQRLVDTCRTGNGQPLARSTVGLALLLKVIWHYC